MALKTYEVDRVGRNDVRLYEVQPNGKREWCQTFATLREAKWAKRRLELNPRARLTDTPARCTLDLIASCARGALVEFLRNPTPENRARLNAELTEYVETFNRAVAET